jgi:DMSO/TMAO reductase YedYZ molybdopterin-dependent catalytic subunit
MKIDALCLTPLTERPFNAETPLAALLENVTPIHLFYVRNHFDVPQIDAQQWRISMGGAVHHPLVLSLSQIESLPHKTLHVTLECAGNGRTAMLPQPSGTPWGVGAVGSAHFTGASLRDLLQRVAPKDNAVEVLFAGADCGIGKRGQPETYTRSLPIDVALHPDTLLVWQMNGAMLTPEHGYPLRLLVPGWYGMAAVKWLTEIRVITRPFDGCFQADEYVFREARGIPDGAPVTRMRVRALIAHPLNGATLPRDAMQVHGVAWSGAGPIRRVEVSFDGGREWQMAEIENGLSEYALQRWRATWQPAAGGPHTLVARAIDAAGNTQPFEPQWNRLGYANNTVHQVSVVVE